MEQRDACAQYFRERPGYGRILEAMLEKYRGLGRVGGDICLQDAGAAECEAARALFGRSFTPPLRLSLQAFEAALQDTKYCGVTLPELLEAYFGAPIQTKKAQSAQRDAAYHAALAEGKEAAECEVCLRWLDALEERGTGGEQLLRQYVAQGIGARILCQTCAAVNWLESHGEAPVRLAVLSARATTDPHALDGSTPGGKLFLYLLAFRAGCAVPLGAEGRDALYFRNGILCDSISSSVTQIGLMLGTEDGEHPAFRAFRLRKESCTVNLTNLARLTEAKSPSGAVYLVENQMVFSQLCDCAAEFRAPLICTSGQLQVAVLRLLDLLGDSGMRFYYAGDFDVGGLSIASRLLERYPGKLHLWHMGTEDYAVCRSEVAVDSTRLDALENGLHPELKTLLFALRKHGQAGYQELLLPQLLHDLTTTP